MTKEDDRPSLVIHGHFYQPPRENPWTEKVERQPDARPFHDWNERVYRECYRGNAYSRIADGENRIEAIVNNYALMSFNFGPTLLAWLDRHHPRTSARIVDADRRSVRERGGHGNAIAQAYNHAILPLCNPRDALTQVRWGLADFRHRFGRDAESLWLPETGCNAETLELLAREGLKYVILAPSQAERVRRIGTQEWTTVADGSIDTRMPYAYVPRTDPSRPLAIFFYHGPIARAIAFEGLLHSSRALLDRFQVAGARAGEVAHIAVDGETFGHHFRFGDRCLAHALVAEAERRGFRVTNYGEFLERHPPTWEVEIKGGPNGEGTSWSCVHGVGRWARDCGCHTGGRDGWTQAWRAPLRKALDHLRNEAARAFEATRGVLFEDPWEARNAYIELILDRSRSHDQFLRRFSKGTLSRADQERALTFLEVQRNALLMYTSCGWFFSDLSGLETVQVIQYAGRALDLLEELGVRSVRGPFLDLLAEARSNLPEMGSGADLFRRHVEPARVTAERMAAHVAIAGLVGTREDPRESGAYDVERRNSRREQRGRLGLSVSRLLLQCAATGRRSDFATLAIHLGEIDFCCAVAPYPGDERFKRASERVMAAFPTVSLPALLRIAQEEFGPGEYGLEDVLPDVRRRIIGELFSTLTRRLAEQYALLYGDHQRTIEMMHASGLDLPPEMRTIAEFTLGRRFEEEIRRIAPSLRPADYLRAVSIADEVNRRGYTIDRAAADLVFDDLLAETVEVAIAEPLPSRLETALAMLELTRRLGVEPPLERAQESLFRAVTESPHERRALRPLILPLGLSPLLAGEEATPYEPVPLLPFRSPS